MAEQRVDGGDVNACGVEPVNDAEGHGEDDGAPIDGLALADEAREQGSQHEDDDDGVDGHQERHGKFDELRETHVGGDEAEQAAP